MAITATGGTITSDATYTYHTFTANGTLSVSGGTLTVDILVVAGGGGGGYGASTVALANGGGGAGGLVYSSNYSIVSGSYSIVVGGGGAAGSKQTTNGSAGTNSTFATTTFVAIGGGFGAGVTSKDVSSNGGDGGSGGGASGGGSPIGYAATGGIATSGQGNNGSTSNLVFASYIYGGSGGGASAAGTQSGGGNGLTYFGNTYAGGGGGGTADVSNNGTTPIPRTGGTGGGGAGGYTPNASGFAETNAISGTANTGGGGGGGSDGASVTALPGSGGSGIVVVRYTTSQLSGTATTSRGVAQSKTRIKLSQLEAVAQSLATLTAYTGLLHVENIGTNQVKAAASSISITTTADVAAGNTIVMAVTVLSGTVVGNSPTFSGSGLTWNLSTAQNFSTGLMAIGYAYCPTGLVAGSTITCTYTSSFTAGAASAHEFQNLGTPTSTQVGGSSFASTTTPSASVSPPANQSNNIIVVALGVNGPSSDTFTQDTDTLEGSWIDITSDGTTGGSQTSNMTLRGAFKINSATSTQTYNPTLGTARAGAYAYANLYATVSTTTLRGYAQSLAKIKGIGLEGLGQAQTNIKRTYIANGNVLSFLIIKTTITRVSQALSQIKQTYPASYTVDNTILIAQTADDAVATLFTTSTTSLGTSSNQDAFLRFNLSSLTETCLSATLYLYNNSVTSLQNIYATTTDWYPISTSDFNAAGTLIGTTSSLASTTWTATTLTASTVQNYFGAYLPLRLTSVSGTTSTFGSFDTGFAAYIVITRTAGIIGAFAQAQAAVKKSISSYAQSFSYIKQIYTTSAQASASIIGTYLAYAQTQSSILQIQIQTAQSGAYVIIVGSASAQSLARILVTGLYSDVIRNTSGLISYWRLDEPSGTIAYDSGPNAFHLTHVNSPTLGGSSPLVNQRGSSAQYSSTAQNWTGVSSGATGYSSLTSVTVEGWVNPNLNKGQQILRFSNHGLRSSFGYSKVDFFLVLSGVNKQPSGGYTFDGQWHHVVGTWNGTTMYVYVDGVQISSLAASGTYAAVSALSIGNNGIHSEWFADASTTEVSFYNRALTAQEVFTHYTLGKGYAQWYGQALAKIKATSNKVAQAKTTLRGVTFSQAHSTVLATSILVNNAFSTIKTSLINVAQAETYLISFNQPVFSQALSNIKFEGNTASNFALAQIQAYDTNQSGNSLVSIKTKYLEITQSLASILSSYVQHSQAIAAIRVQINAQAQSSIVSIYQVFSQCIAYVITTNTAYAQALSFILLINQKYGSSIAKINIISKNYAQAYAQIRRLSLYNQFSLGPDSAYSVNTRARHYWRLDEGTGATISLDDSWPTNASTRQPLKSVGSPTFQINGAVPDSTGVLLNSNDYLPTIGGSLTSAPNRAFTIEGWIKVDVDQTNNINYLLYSQRLAIQIDSTTKYAKAILDTYTATGNQNLADNNWHYIAVTWNGQSTSLLLYVDGVFVAQSAATGSFTSTWSNFSLGGPSSGTQSIDEVAIYDSVLTSSEILYHYNLGKGYIQKYNQSAAKIKATSTNIGQSAALIGFKLSIGQALAKIQIVSIKTAQALGQILLVNQAFAQAQTSVRATVFAQAESTILANYVVYGIVQSSILTHYEFSALAQARIISFEQNAIGQALSNIMFVGYTYSGQAQARLLSYDVPNYSNALSTITANYTITAQSEASIKTYYVQIAQAMASIRVQVVSQAQSQILLVVYVNAQASAQILLVNKESGQAQATFRGQAFTESIAYIKSNVCAFGQASVWVLQQNIVSNGQAGTSILSTSTATSNAQVTILAIVTQSALSQALLQTTENPTAQALSIILSTTSQVAQVNGSVLQVYINFAQTITTIKQKYLIYGLANSSVLTNYIQSGNSFACILNTYQNYGIAASSVKSTYIASTEVQATVKTNYTVISQSQTKLNSFDINNFANAFSNIKGTIAGGLANAEAKINAFDVLVYGQAETSIKTNYTAIAQSQALIKTTTTQLSQTLAQILSTSSVSATVLGTILSSYISNAVAHSLILSTSENTAIAQSSILAEYQVNASVQSTIKTQYIEYGNAASLIKTTSFVYSQAIAAIKSTVCAEGLSQAVVKTTEVQFAQSFATIKQEYSTSTYASTWIVSSYFNTANAMAAVRGKAFAQAVSYIIIVDIQVFGYAAATIKNTYIVNASAVSTILASYLVYSVSEALILQTYFNSAETQATIKSTILLVAQAQACVQGTAFGQAQTGILAQYIETTLSASWIKSINTEIAQSQAQLISFDQTAFGQALSNIKFDGNAVTGQADAKINAFDVNAYGIVETSIKASYAANAQAISTTLTAYYQVAQAQAAIRVMVHGLAEADIVATDAVFAQALSHIQITVIAYGIANATIKQTSQDNGQAQTAVRGKAYSQSEGYIQVTDISVQAIVQADIVQAYTASAVADANIKQSYVDFGFANTSIKQIYIEYGQAFTSIKQAFVVHALGIVNIKAEAFVSATANASIKATYVANGQAEAKLNSFDQNAFGQAQTNILFTGNASAGQALARLLSFDQTTFGQTQADILAIYAAHGLASSGVKSIYNNCANALADIVVTFNTTGIALATIKATRAIVGQANADIKATATVSGQAKSVVILRNNRRYGQSVAWVKVSGIPAFGQAGAAIRVQIHSQTIAYIKTDRNLLIANAQGYIKTSVIVVAQAKLWIKTSAMVFAQAVFAIKAVSSASGQAVSFVQILNIKPAQAIAYMKPLLLKQLIVKDRSLILLNLSDKLKENINNNNKTVISLTIKDRSQIGLRITDIVRTAVSLNDVDY